MGSLAARIIGNNITQRRASAGLTQKDLAAACGISAVQLSRYERGQQQPGDEALLSISKALGCDPDDLFDKTALLGKAMEVGEELGETWRLMAETFRRATDELTAVSKDQRAEIAHLRARLKELEEKKGGKR